MALLDDLRAEADAAIKTRWEHGKLYFLIGGVVFIALALVMIAMGLYNSSGAAELDLSGPRYSDVQKRVNKEEKDAETFPSSGEFDAKSFADFKKLYDERVSSIKATKGYDPTAVANDSFNLVPQNTPQP